MSPLLFALALGIGPAAADEPAPEANETVDQAADEPVVDEAVEPSCGLTVLREVDPTIDLPLPPGLAACKVALLVDERGRVAEIEATECPDDALAAARPDLEKWRFRRDEHCPAEELARFELAVESESRTFHVPPAEKVPAERFAVTGFDGCVLALTLLPDGTVEALRSSDPDACTVAPGFAGWNPERFWRHEITGLRCTATFDANGGLANDVRFEGCGGPSRMALLSFVERARWGTGLDPRTAFKVHFRLRDDESEPLDRVSEQARLVRTEPCEDLRASERLYGRTRIPPMPARWAMDRSEVAAYCRLRVHLDAQAVPRRIDGVLCGDVFAPRAASALATWDFTAPTCGGEPVPSEVIVLVPFAERVAGLDGLRNPFTDEPVVDLAAEVQPMYGAAPGEHCQMVIDVPVRGRVRLQTNDRRRCFVTPTTIPSVPAREVRRWGEAVNEPSELEDAIAAAAADSLVHVISCNSAFRVTTTAVENLSVSGCIGRAPDRVRAAIADWSWSVLGREQERYEVEWRFRIE